MSGKRIAMLAMGVLIVAALAACSAGEAQETEEEELYDLTTILYDAGKFTTNIKDSKIILSCSIKMDLISERLSEVLVEKDYVVRDLINARLRQLTEQELLTLDQEKLGESLVVSLNEAMNTKGFYKVYFTDIVYG